VTSRRIRGSLAAALLGLSLIFGTLAMAVPADAAYGPVSATTSVNIRSGPSASSKVLGVLSKGASLTQTGASVNGWTPVSYLGAKAWIKARYLTVTATASPSTGGKASVSSQTGPAGTATATLTVNVRSGPGTSYAAVGVLQLGMTVTATGVRSGGWTQVNWNGSVRWISTSCLTFAAVASTGTTALWTAVIPGCNGVPGSLNTGGSVGLDQMTANAKGVACTVKAVFPVITTMYGVRPDPLPDHPSGHAVDIMLPDYKHNADLGWAIASYMRTNALALNIQYVIYRQQIWNIARDSEGWRPMADRGSDTANHMDHVHVTVK